MGPHLIRLAFAALLRVNGGQRWQSRALLQIAVLGSYPTMRHVVGLLRCPNVLCSVQTLRKLPVHLVQHSQTRVQVVQGMHAAAEPACLPFARG